MLPPPLLSASCLELIPHAEVVLAHNPGCSLHAWLQSCSTLLFSLWTWTWVIQHPCCHTWHTHFHTTNNSPIKCVSVRNTGDRTLLLTISQNNCNLSTTWWPSGSVALHIHRDVSTPQRWWLCTWLPQAFNGFLFCLLHVFLSDRGGSSLREWVWLTDRLTLLKRECTWTVGPKVFSPYKKGYWTWGNIKMIRKMLDFKISTAYTKRSWVACRSTSKKDQPPYLLITSFSLWVNTTILAKKNGSN